MLPPKHATQSLAATKTGDVILIQRILFEGLRTRCSELDIFEGDTVRCRAGTPSHLMLQTQRGRTIALERDWARFIQVAKEPTATLTP
jgi:FeoA-like protein